MAWQLLDDGDPPPASSVNSSIAYDSIRGVAVQLRVENDPDTTWELIGEDWKRKVLQGPDANLGCSAFDPVRGVIVYFGGYLNGSMIDQTWEYDGVAWSQVFPAVRPSPREECSMVWDDDRQSMILFGGFSDVGFIGIADTWEYDGTTWTQLSTRDVPGARGWAGMTYDVGRNEVVLFGGRNLDQLYSDTWVYNGRNWRLKKPGTIPVARQSPGLAYDPALGKTILFSGNTYTGNVDDTWEWNGTDWTQLFPATSPPPRPSKLNFDTVRGQVLLHGGDGYNDTWVFDGVTWTQIALSGLPQNRYLHALAYDGSRDAVVLYGGRVNGLNTGISFLWDTWHHTDSGWEEQTGVTPPSASQIPPLVYDEQYGMLVGFSGLDDLSINGVEDTHRYDGHPAEWEDVPTFNPASRSRHSFAYAGPLGGSILFGGEVCCFVNSPFTDNDTWLYDGIGWTELFPTTSPEPRSWSSMAFDKNLEEIVLYGGQLDGSHFDDSTWLFDGTNWTLHSTNDPPGERDGHSMAYDASRGVTVLYGSAPTGTEGVTWEFDGTSWNGRSTPFQPETDRRNMPLTYDPVRQVIWMFGGDGDGLYNDTWAYGADPDQDGIVGLLDNCVDAANEDQANGDGDAAGDVCDCAVADPGAFGIPGEIAYLGWAGSEIQWDDQAPLVGADVRYDLVSGLVSELLGDRDFSRAACLAQDLVSPTYTDSRAPLLGDGYYYLVRSKNVCGVGTYGAAHVGLDALAPCP